MTAAGRAGGAVRRVEVRPGITLGQFLKVAGVAATGGHAKALIQDGAVLVDGAVEWRRGHRLSAGALVEVEGHRLRVVERRAGGRAPDAA
jgi:ribosome-associated protein